MTLKERVRSPALSAPEGGRGWGLAVALIALSAIPLTVGLLRLIQLAGPAVIPADPRFDPFPVAIVLHISGSAVFALLGVLQFMPRFRRRHRRRHRGAGRLLIVAGLIVVASALWLTLGYDAHPGTGRVLFVVRLVVAPAMALCLVQGFVAIRRRDATNHRAWMIRAYALALGAGTQVFTEGLGGLLFGTGVLAGDLAKGAAWVVNLAVAEWVIRRQSGRGSDRAGASASVLR